MTSLSRLSVKNLQITFSLFFVLVILLSVFFRVGLAEDSSAKQGLEVSPPSQEIKADPGTTSIVKAKVRNKSGQKVNVNVRIEDFTSSGDEGGVALVDNKNKDSLTEWAVLDENNFSLEPNESREVTARISLPASVAGGQYGSFVFGISGGPTNPGEASISQELASLFLMRVSGPVREDMIMTALEVPSFLEFGPVDMNLKFKNVGNVHLKPFGLVNVRNVFGKTVADIVVRGETNVFPGAERKIKISFEDKWLLGPYTAQALINYGTKNNSLSVTSTFFVFPVRIFIALLVIVLILFKSRRRISKAYKALIGK